MQRILASGELLEDREMAELLKDELAVLGQSVSVNCFMTCDDWIVAA